ncbi:unnamed protein product [Blumeria hordei]|uniref:Uncharacterized protein n=1 Tax=Blumeria hordei TaxID=2867405 RepID=A0A383V020_BLUHO|nr:unnamed protein product [Blumeria hordei]
MASHEPTLALWTLMIKGVVRRYTYYLSTTQCIWYCFGLGPAGYGYRTHPCLEGASEFVNLLTIREFHQITC